ncbi:hypothetical protein DMP51_29680 [Klebsiella pneumoniae]|nr:hypothetical protein DMP51_29680 [Klebsiella pneumoniae]
MINQGSEFAMMARMALAAMDSEPVIVVGDDGGDALSYRRLIQSFEPGTKLYRHAQPAPVVPEEKPIPNTLSMYAVDAVAAIAEVKGWNACRAAMLAAAPQSPGGDHATVPGKWIPVSERMPEVGDIVLTAMGGAVNVGEMECSAANCRFFTSVISGRELPATHWMPLPAGPKEDIKALIPLVSRNEQEGK